MKNLETKIKSFDLNWEYHEKLGKRIGCFLTILFPLTVALGLAIMCAVGYGIYYVITSPAVTKILGY